MYLKIINLFDMFGQPDYKGLDINLFVPGSQVYDLKAGICYVKTSEQSVPQNADITVLSEADYIAGTNVIKEAIQTSEQTMEQKVQDLQSQNAQMLFALVNGGLM